MKFTELPDELKIMILEHLEVKQRISLRLISKEYNLLVNQTFHTLTLEDFSFTLFNQTLKQRLSRFSFLNYLKIEKSKRLSDDLLTETFLYLKEGETKIKKLKLNFCDLLKSPCVELSNVEEVSIQSCSSLEKIKIESKKLKKLEFGFKSLYGCNALKKVELHPEVEISYLDISVSPWSQESLMDLLTYQRMGNSLRELHLVSCPLSSFEGVSLKNLKNLNVLNLYSTRVDDAFLRDNIPFLSNLRELNLSNCLVLMNPEIKNFNLEKIKLGKTSIKNPVLECNNLTSLHLDFCTQLKNPVVESSHLIYLDLR
jgi:hypothetical protein